MKINKKLRMYPFILIVLMIFGCAEEEESQFNDINKDWLRDTSTKIVEVTSPETGRIWMDRNLGASRAAMNASDDEAYGDLYQWGRAADGHEKRNSATTSVVSSFDKPEHGDFITASNNSNWDWRSPSNADLWQGLNGVNNPCPKGFRLPTEAEWEAERKAWSVKNAEGAFLSFLKLTCAGDRSNIDGEIENVGSYGTYWSSNASRALEIAYSDIYTKMRTYNRANGNCVRCIKE